MATKNREAADKSKSGLEKKVLDLVVQVKDLDERLDTSLMQLQVSLLGHTSGVTVPVCCITGSEICLFAVKAGAGHTCQR